MKMLIPPFLNLAKARESEVRVSHWQKRQEGNGHGHLPAPYKQNDVVDRQQEDGGREEQDCGTQVEEVNESLETKTKETTALVKLETGISGAR